MFISLARAVAWVRLRACSFRKMLFTWDLTVLVETNSLAAICRFDSPAAMSASTSSSRSLKGSARRPSVVGFAASCSKAARSFAR